MSESEGAGVQSDEDDCPLCLESLPPFWDRSRRVPLYCCGKFVCKDCRDKKIALVERAIADGSYGKEEEQLGCCPFCRTDIEEDDMAKVLEQQFNDGRLPLSWYQELGMCYIEGRDGVVQNVERGVEILMTGAERGDPNCQFTIGNKYDQGEIGLPKSPEDAKRWWLAAAEQGHARAEFNLAIILSEEGDGDAYLRYTKSSASKGYNNACYNLGLAHYKGECGLQRSPEEAIRVLTPVAERGHAQSMSYLGYIMCMPQNQELNTLPTYNPNFTKGMHWVRRATEKGDEIAMATLADLEKWASSKCFNCNKKAPPETAFLRCSRCRAAWYCSKDCQIQRWKAKEGGHKQFCIKWRPQK